MTKWGRTGEGYAFSGDSFFFFQITSVGDPEEKEGKRPCYSLKMHRVGTVAGQISSGKPLSKLHVKCMKKVHIYLMHSQQRVQK